MADQRRIRKETSSKLLKTINKGTKVHVIERKTPSREHTRVHIRKVTETSDKIITPVKKTRKEAQEQGQKGIEATQKITSQRETVTTAPIRKEKSENKPYRSKACRKRYQLKEKRKVESETNFSTLIHNLDSRVIIPNRIARILNFNLKYNFDSVPSRKQIELDLKLFTHRVVAAGIRCCQIPNPNKTISTFEPRFLIRDQKDRIYENSEVPELQAYLVIAKQKIREDFPKLQTRRLFQNNDRRTLSEWFQNNNVVVKQTDKNLGIAIIPISVYHSKVMELLKDERTYKRIDDFNPETLANDYSAYLDEYILKKIRYSAQELAFLIYSCSSKFELPQFHIIPKIHKDPWIGRPIVSSVKYLTRNLAVWINTFLEKIAKTIPTILKDSKQLVQLLDGKRVSPNTNFFSLDAIAMYTNIPLLKTFEAMRSSPEIYPEYIIRGIEFCCQNNFFQYMDETYQQLDGIPMGINFAVAFANISVFILVETSPQLLQFRNNIEFWGRYIDDCNGLWNGTRAEFERFFAVMNTIDNSIQWTIGEFGKRVVYLDLVAIIDDSNTIVFELYQKKLNKYLYLPFHSNHSLATKKGWIKGELIRLCRNNSKIDSFQKCVNLFFNRLRERSYPHDFIIAIYEQFSYNTRHSLLIMEENPFDTIPNTAMEQFFQNKMKSFHKRAIEEFGLNVYNDKQSQTLTFITNYNSQIKKLELKKKLNPLPAFEVYKKYPESEVQIGYRINNTLGSIFSHKEHNKKLKTYLDQHLENNN